MRIFTGLKPTGELTLGNYIGSILNFDQNGITKDNSLLCIADLHAITVNPPENTELKRLVREQLAMYIALNIHNKTNIYLQSHIPAHSQLAWILTCFSKNGELDRMTQYKDKKDQSSSTSTGLYTYPILMAADILLYDTTHVPVGIDQKQHVEFCRNVADRFNSYYNCDLFTIPEPIIDQNTKKIYSLTDPSKKMSKSSTTPKSHILLTDSRSVVLKKMKSAVTDSLGIINYDVENQPGVSNLLSIYMAMKNISMNETLNHFDQQSYGFLKTEVAASISDVLEPVQKRYYEILEDETIINEVLTSGAKFASKIASKKIDDVYSIIGYL